MQKQRKAKPAKRSSFQEGHIQIGYAIDLSKGKHADELKVKKCTHAKASSMEKSPNEAPFFQERSSLIGLSILVHKLAVELKGKLQDGIPVSALYVKNAKDN